MKLLNTTADMNDAIATITSTGLRLDKRIHVMCVSSALHAVKDGDATYINKLIAALPKGSRSVAVKAWFDAYAPVVYNEEDKLFSIDKALARVGREQITEDTPIPVAVMAGIETSWVECKPEQPYQPLNFQKMIQKAIASAEKRQRELVKSGDTTSDKIDPKLLASVKALMPAKES